MTLAHLRAAGLILGNGNFFYQLVKAIGGFVASFKIGTLVYLAFLTSQTKKQSVRVEPHVGCVTEIASSSAA